MRASGLRFNAFAFSALMINNAAAPSFNPDEFPAVTVPPSLAKAGLSFAKRFHASYHGAGVHRYPRSLGRLFSVGWQREGSPALKRPESIAAMAR